MRTTSATYQSLLTAVGTWCEIRVIVGSTTYTADNFKRIKIWSSLFENNGPVIGGTISAEIELITYLETTDWPRMAKFMVDYRLVSDDELTTSEWIRLGTFYTAYRIPNSGGTLTIHGMDPMRLLEQTWTDKISDEDMPASWPITARQAVDLILLATGTQLDPRTSLDNTTPFIGLDTTSTARKVLESVAAGMGANWCITPEGKLRLIPLKLIYRNVPPAIAGIAIAGQSIVGMGVRDVALEPDVSKFSAGEALPAITQVSITAEDGAVAESGTTGYTVNANANFSSTDIAVLALSKMQGFQYHPFDTDIVWIDPAAELGDFMIVDGFAYPIYQMDIHIQKHIVAACSAPAENEIDEEYVIIPEAARTLQKSLQAVSEIQQQVDGKIESWYQLADPSLSWTSEDERSAHTGDLWYRTSDHTTHRWTGSEWEDQDVPTSVFDAIDGKAQIFVSQPAPPYYVGDLWVQGSTGDILKCSTERETGNFNSGDWGLASKYTDDSELTEFVSTIYTPQIATLQNDLETAQVSLNSSIQQTAQQIRTEVAAEYYTDDETDTLIAGVQSQVTQTNNSLSVEITSVRNESNDNYNEIKTYVRYANGQVVIGQSNSQSDLRVSNTEVGMYYGGTKTTYWNQNEQVTPNKVRIPVGGSLQEGNFIWQPRSSGNLSLMWVGGN